VLKNAENHCGRNSGCPVPPEGGRRGIAYPGIHEQRLVTTHKNKSSCRVNN
jgi:hypothetical protein